MKITFRLKRKTLKQTITIFFLNDFFDLRAFRVLSLASSDLCVFLNCFTKSQDVSVVNIHLCWLLLSFGNRSGIKAPALWFWGKPLRNSLRHKRVKRGHWKYCLTIYRLRGLSCLHVCTTILYTPTYMYELLKLVLFNACLERTDCCRKKKEVVTGKCWEMLCLYMVMVTPYAP